MTTTFQYVIEGSPIDFFHACLTKEELISNYKADAFVGNLDVFKAEVEQCVNYVKDIVNKKSDELPHTIRFFAIPKFDYCDMEICVLAKISNNGSTYMFTNNEGFAKFIASESGYDFRVIRL